MAQSKNYFTQETEDAIVLYNATDDLLTRNRIYNQKIKYAFFKLTENIIHTYKFYYTNDESLEDLQHEVTTFLLTKLHLFNPGKGAKAYSYFGTIAKRYLIMINTKNYKRRVDKAEIIEIEDSYDHSYNVITDVESDPNLSLFIDEFVRYTSENLYNLFSKGEDAKIADAILELFRQRGKLDVLNKKALYIYIREQIDVKTPKITKIANDLYKQFKDSYITYLDEGYIKF
jgi:hypothetical protein